jgi:hypothetical protein
MGYGFIFPVWRLRWIWTRIIFPVKIPNNIIFIIFFSIILKHLQIKMLTLNCKSYLQNCSMLWRSNIFIKLVFYIVAFVYWNIVCTESCMYKSILRKINKLHKNNCPPTCNMTYLNNYSSLLQLEIVSFYYFTWTSDKV